MRQKLIYFVLFAILLSAIYKIYFANIKDLWFDEALTYHFSKLPLSKLFLVVASDNNPPLYYLLVHFSLLIGKSEIVIRSLSLFTNIISAILIFVVGKKISQKTGLFASVSFSLSPLSLYLATEARLHSLGILFTILIIWYQQNFKKHPNLFAGVIIFSLALYTQYYLSLLLLILTIFQYNSLSSKLLKKWITTVIFSFILLVPWLIYSSRFPHNNCACSNSLIALPATISSAFLGGVGNVSLRYFTQLDFITLLIFTITLIWGLIIFAKGVKNDYFFKIYLWCMIILSILDLFFPLFSPKAASIFSPLFFLTFGYGLSKLKKRSIPVIFFFILFTISIIQVINPFFNGDQLKLSLEKINIDKSHIILHTSLATYYSYQYYGQNYQNLLLTLNPLQKIMVQEIGGLTSNIPSSSYLWLVDNPRLANTNEREKKIKEILLEYHIKEKYQFKENVNLYLLNKI